MKYFLTGLYAKRDAIKSISSGYFGGKPLLFSDLAITLDLFIAYTESLAEAFNNVLSFDRTEAARIDLESTLAQSNKERDRQRAQIVYVAKSEALDFMGDDDGAEVLAEELLNLDTNAPDPVILIGVPFGRGEQGDWTR